MTEQQDDITVVLRECEKTLRRLSAEGRLAESGLAAFVELSRNIQREMERRRQADRRAVPRSEPERRRMEQGKEGPAWEAVRFDAVESGQP